MKAQFGLRQTDSHNTIRERQRGQLLIEILIALALLGVISTVFIGAMYTALQSARVADERSIALTLAKSEIEFAKQQTYSSTPWAYMVDSAAPGRPYPDADLDPPSWWPEPPPPQLSVADFAGYAVFIKATDHEDGEYGMRTITCTVKHQGVPIFTLEDFEVKR